MKELKRMKYKVLSVGNCTLYDYINIGDYIQALAATQFLPHIDGFVDRDTDLDKVTEKTVLIMNGWFMYLPNNWPPSKNVYPLFVAFHINSNVKDALTSPDSITYLKDNEPIGCRDKNTVDLLRKKGVEAYFSGCLTLTLGKKFKSDSRNEKVYIVEPTNHIRWTMSVILHYALKIPCHIKEIGILMRKQCIGSHLSALKRILYISAFYDTYSKVIDVKTLLNADYIEQLSERYRKEFDTNVKRLREAERIVRLYASAGLVITSRIHCALPCLGLDTPVIFIEDANQDDLSKNRMQGISELFNRFIYDNGQIIPDFEINSKLSIGTCPPNKDTWKKLASDLITRCEDFFKFVEEL